jgi:hypothetical protein
LASGHDLKLILQFLHVKQTITATGNGGGNRTRRVPKVTRILLEPSPGQGTSGLGGMIDGIVDAASHPSTLFNNYLNNYAGQPANTNRQHVNSQVSTNAEAEVVAG